MSSGVSVTLTPVYGAQGGGAPLCSLLTIDGVRILLDCGWSDTFDVAAIEALKALAPSIDIVLLSHPDLTHLGAVPMLLSVWKSSALVFSTLPVNRMGQMFLYEAYLARSAADASFSTFSLDDVDASFRLVNFPGGRWDILRYSEERTLKGITFSALQSGRMIGGSLWRISKGPESILYAVGFNHRTERHLGKAGGLSLSALHRRPTLMISDAVNGLVIHPVPSAAAAAALSANVSGKDQAAGAAATKASVRDAADRELVDTILTALRSGGNVLLPTDSAGRCLELLLRIDGAWPDQPEGQGREAEIDFPIVFLSHVSAWAWADIPVYLLSTQASARAAGAGSYRCVKTRVRLLIGTLAYPSSSTAIFISFVFDLPSSI